LIDVIKLQSQRERPVQTNVKEMQNRHSRQKKADGAAIKVLLLGPMQIHVGGQRVELSARKARALFAYLALRCGETVSRETLAGLLWGDREEEQARASLRQTLSAIRKALGDEAAKSLIATNEHVTLDSEAIFVDAVELEQNVDASDTDDLVAVAELYRGELLEGLTLNEPEYDHWLSAERESARAVIFRVLSRLIELMEQERRIEDAISYSAKLLTMDPLQEHVHCMLMRLYMNQGRYDVALNQFEQCKRELAKQLDVAPEQATLDLVNEIRTRRRQPANGNNEGDEPSPENTATSSYTPPIMQPPTLPDKPSIAVLPFSNMSNDPEQEYFSDGITESIINGLARFREILVIGVKSILIVRDQTNDLREIGRVLGVAHILEGSVQKVGNRVRVTVHLIDASNRQRLWAENYDRDFGDVFAVQDEITNVIVSTLAGQIEYLELHRAIDISGDDIGAYDCLLKGRRGLNLYSMKGVIEARLQFKRALDIDPDYAAAFAGLALSYIHEYEGSWSKNYEEALVQVEKYAQKALTHDDTDCQALYAISSLSYYRGQFEMANAYVEKALELNPNDYHIMCNKGYFLAFGDQTSEGIACSIEAMRLNPLTPDNCMFSIGVAEYFEGRYKDALKSFSKAKGWGLLRPAFIAACCAQLDRDAQAQAAADEVRALSTDDPSISDKMDLEQWRVYWSRIMKFENPIYWEKFLEGIRKAGLPA
jgi:TolB-like protein/DNA-binding SARP family transcriptional activator/Tfp pilus assembly protein PilF